MFARSCRNSFAPDAEGDCGLREEAGHGPDGRRLRRMIRQARISEACCRRVSDPQLWRMHTRTVTTICCAHSSRASRLTPIRREGRGKDRLRCLARVGHHQQCHGSEYHRGCEHGGPAHPAHQFSAMQTHHHPQAWALVALVAPGTLPRTSAARHAKEHAAEAQRCLTALNWRPPGAARRWCPSLLLSGWLFWYSGHDPFPVNLFFLKNTVCSLS